MAKKKQLGLTITPEMMAAAYDYLQLTPPFCKWNLPDSEDVVFKVIRSIDRRGDFHVSNGRQVIRISSRNIIATNSLIETMAHEMVHLHEDHNNCSGSGEHSAAFWEWAREVCSFHGWDPALF